MMSDWYRSVNSRTAPLVTLMPSLRAWRECGGGQAGGGGRGGTWKKGPRKVEKYCCEVVSPSVALCIRCILVGAVDAPIPNFTASHCQACHAGTLHSAHSQEHTAVVYTALQACRTPSTRTCNLAAGAHRPQPPHPTPPEVVVDVATEYGAMLRWPGRQPCAGLVI